MRFHQLRVLYHVWRAWRRMPQLRLGQLLEARTTYTGCSLFYVTDANLVVFLDSLPHSLKS